MTTRPLATQHSNRVILLAETVPIAGDGIHLERDGCIRADTTLDALQSLKPAFDVNGTGDRDALAANAIAQLVKAKPATFWSCWKTRSSSCPSSVTMR